ncbi:hypothetical protein [Endozoicomonas sp.]|uniref:hypothetical protein n=1 Tax=Endozoicomonas sp. TaxID=1892382 RepID=UPI003839D8D0
MAITNNDVKLFESQRLTDEEDGGGRVTGSEVIDGNVNNLFQDISRIDRTIGDVALRKAFIGISTDNNKNGVRSFFLNKNGVRSFFLNNHQRELLPLI